MSTLKEAFDAWWGKQRNTLGTSPAPEAKGWAWAAWRDALAAEPMSLADLEATARDAFVLHRNEHMFLRFAPNEHAEWNFIEGFIQGARTLPMTALAAEPEPTALQEFNKCGGHEETSPLERLRFFCSLSMSGQDWLDVEPFFDALSEDKSSQTIKLRCKCGATFEMGCAEFINRGGAHDTKHRVFIAELRAEEWLDRHQNCQPAQISGLTVPMVVPGPVTCGA